MASKLTSKSFRSLFLVAVAFLCMGFSVKMADAATRVWDGEGADANWSTCGNWSADTCPLAADIVTFNSTSTKNSTIDAGWTASSGQITTFNMSSGYTGTITQARSFTVSGVTTIAAGSFAGNTSDLTFTGAYSQSAGTFTGGTQNITFSAGFTLSGGTYNASSGTQTMNGAWTHTAGGTFNCGSSGTVVFAGAATATNVMVTETFYNLTINKNDGVAMTVASGDTLAVGNTLTLTNGGWITGTIETTHNISVGAGWDGNSGGATGTLLVDGSNTFTLSITGGANALSGIVTLNATNVTVSGTGTGVLNFNNFNLQAGTFDSTGYATTFAGAYDQSGGTFTAVATAITHTGAFTLSAGTYNTTSATTTFSAGFTHTAGGTFDGDNGSVSITGGAATFNVTTSETFNNLTLNKTTATALTVASGDTLIITGTATLTDGNLTTGTLDCRGTTTWASTFDGGTGTVLLGGSATVSATFNGGNGGVNLSMTNANVTADTAGSGTVAFGSFTLSNGTFNGGSLNMSINGSYNQSGGTFNSTTGTLTFSASFTHSAGTLDGNNGSISVTGGGTATFNSTSGENFNNFTLNKTTATSFTISGATIVVEGTATLTDGNLTTGTLDCRGTTSWASTFDGGTGTVLLGGSATVTATLNSGNTAVNVNITNANVTATTAGAGTVAISTFTMSNGIFNANAVTTSMGAVNINGGTFNGGSAAITITGLYTQTAGTFNTTTGTLTFSGGGFTHTAGGTFDGNNGSVSITGGGTVTFNFNVSEIFNNVTLNKTTATSFTISSGDTMTVEGSLTLTDGKLDTGTIDAQGAVTHATTFDGGTGTLQVSGSATRTINLTSGGLPNVILNATNVTMTASTSGTTTFAALTVQAGTVTSSADFTVGGAYIQSGGTFTCATGTTTFGGNFTHTAGGTFTTGSGTVKATGTDVNWDFNTSETFNNFTVQMSNDQDLRVAVGDTLIVNGALNLTDGILGESTGIAFTVEVKGDITQGPLWDGTYTVLSGGDVVGFTMLIDGTSTQTVSIDASSGKSTAPYLVMNNSSATMSWTGAGSIAEKTITLQAGTINFGSYTASLVDDLTISGGTFTSTSGTLTIGGSFIHTSGGTFNNNSGTIEWAISDSTEIINVATSETFNNVTLNGCGCTLTISGGTVITTGTLTLSNGSFNTGTLEAQGAVTVTSSYDGGTSPLLFSGTANQNFDLTGATAAYNGDITINKPVSGTVTLLSALTADATGQNFTLTAGTFNPANFAVAVNGDYSQAAGTYSSGTGTLDINGGFTLSGGTFNAPSGVNMLVGGAWTHTDGGTFTHNSGTVIFDTTTGVNIDVMTTEIFYNVTKNGAAISKTIVSGDTLIVTGTLTLDNGTFDTGTLEAQGDVSIGSSWDPGTAALTFSGTANQNFTITTSPGLFDGNVTVNKPVSGTVTLQTAFTANASGQTLTITAGTFYTNGKTLIVNGASGGAMTVASAGTLQLQGGETFTITTLNLNTGSTVKYVGDGDTAADTFTLKDFGATDYYNLTIATTDSSDIIQSASSSAKVLSGGLTISSGTLDANGNTFSIAGTTTLSGGTYSTSTATQTLADLTVSGGILTGSSGTVDVNGNIDLSSGTLTAPSGSITLQGNFTKSGGTFTHNSGTVTLDANANHSITGSVSWNSLTLQDTSDNATDVVLTLEVGSTQTINGTLTLDGLDASDRLNIVSSSGASTATFDFQGSSTFTGDFLDIMDSIVTDNSSGLSTPVNPANSVDSGNNTDWFSGAPGITVSVITGPTTEGGGTATFTVVLNTLPTADVAIGITSNDTTEGTVSAATLTFTTGNWNIQQTVTVTGVNDDLDDGDIAYSIITAAASSADGGYNGLNASDVSVINTDNDSSGITVGAISGPVSEVENTATYTVVLTAQPTADVSIGVSSTDITEGTVSPSSLTFTSVNWATPQTVTVTGVNDAIVDGTIAFSIVNSAATSADTNYNGINPADVSVNCTDNDTASITIGAVSGDTTEAGGIATFTVVLTSQPSADVTMGITSNDTTEGTVSASSLTFTSVNWNTPQTITITGVDDFVVDGNIAYSIITVAASSADSNYNTLNASDVSLSNTDNDTVGITVSVISGPTTEAGGTATFTVVLDTLPTASVSIGLTSDDTTEGTVSPSSLTFTTGNWNIQQTVTMTGVDDDLDDGDIAYSIVTAAATSADTDYNTLNPADVSVTTTDNDASGFTVGAISGPVSEAGTTATYTVVLTAKPTADVSIGVSSGDATEGSVSPSSLTFTASNWATPQTVTVTGMNDDVDDGDISYSIVNAAATSSDTNYNGLNPADVSVTTTDNDTAGVTVSAISGDTTEGGVTATFTLVLTSQPTASVTIGLSSSDLTEGTISPSSVTFTTLNWSAPKFVTVTGVNDSLDDGDIVYHVTTGLASSADPVYNGINPTNVTLTNLDNDSPAGITVSAITGPTTEAGGTATFTVVLDLEPTDDVTVGISSNDTTEGTVSTSSLTFTALDWNIEQTVTVTGVNDDLDDGDISYSIVTAAAVSDDVNYSGINPSNVSVTNTDNDTAGITVGTITGPTTEGGGTATFTVVLDTKPTATVTIGISSNDTTEGTVSPSSLSFTTANWATPQTVTVTGVDDVLVDGDIAYSIVTAAASSSDTNYNAMNASDVSVTNTDNDAAAGVTITAITGPTTEGGGNATFTVVLDYAPDSNVVIGLSSDDTTEGTVSPSSLTFTALDWLTPQTVTVTGVDDSLDDGDIVYSIVTAAATSSDVDYIGFNASNVSVTNTDNDTAGIIVTESSASTDLTEGGATDTYTIVLNTQPTANVTVSFTVGSQLSLSSSSFTFTSVNWATPQTLTVTAVNDFVAEGTHTATVSHTVSSSDTNYNAYSLSSVTAHITDNDTAGITVSAITGTVSETGTMATYTVVLTSQPTADVTIGISSNDTTEGTVSPSSRTFTSVNWATPQTVTVTGVNDFLVDGTVAFSIVNAAATSSDTNYNGIDPADVSVNCTDNDTAGFSVSAISGSVSEAGTMATFTINLTSQPTADVTIGISSNDTTEGTVLPTSLTFTSVDWNNPQTVTVTGVDDALVDGTVSFSIVNAAATSSDTDYSGLNPADVSVSCTDNDAASVVVTQSSGNTAVSEAGITDSYTVVLTTMPTDDVIVTFTGNAQISLSASTMTFTTGDWNIPQTLTVTAVNDSIAEGPHTASIIHSVNSFDTSYNGFTLSNVTVNITDNDSAGFTVGAVSGNVSESGTTATYTVVLTSQPTANVSFNVVSSDTSVGTVSPSSLTFTSATWNFTQTVTITGVDNHIIDGTVPFTIVNDVASSADAFYNSLNPADISLSRTDNDVAGITLTESSGTTAVTEGGATDSVSLVLTAQPTEDVLVSFTGDAQISLSAASMIFTSLNWDTPQTLTITAVDDESVESETTVTITSVVTSADGNFDALSLASVSVTVTDDDAEAPSSSGGGGGGGGSSSGTSDSHGTSGHSKDEEEDDFWDQYEVPDHWSESYIKYLEEQDNIEEVAINTPTFADILQTLFTTPNVGVKRAEVLEFLLAIAGYDVQTVTINWREMPFDDVTEANERAGQIFFAAEHGLVNGYPDGTFKSERIINRAEVLKMCGNFFHSEIPIALRGQALLDYYGVKNPFSDVDLTQWYAPYVIFAYSKGIIIGYPDGTYKPAQNVSMAELLKIAVLMQNSEDAVEMASELE